MAFTHARTVRFADVDAAGIVFFSRAFEFAHAAFEALLADAGLPLERILDSHSWVMPLVHASADYKRPMRLGDALAIEVGVARLGTSSVSFRFLIRGAGGELHATVSHVHACIATAGDGAGRPRPLPDVVRTALTPHVFEQPAAGDRT